MAIYGSNFGALTQKPIFKTTGHQGYNAGTNASLGAINPRVAQAPSKSVEHSQKMAKAVNANLGVEDFEAASKAIDLFNNLGTTDAIASNASAFDADAVFANANDGEVHPKGIKSLAA